MIFKRWFLKLGLQKSNGNTKPQEPSDIEPEEIWDPEVYRIGSALLRTKEWIGGVR
jgi:hypothetical protein